MTDFKTCVKEETENLTEVTPSSLDEINKKCQEKFNLSTRTFNPAPKKNPGMGMFGYVLVFGLIIILIFALKGVPRETQTLPAATGGTVAVPPEPTTPAAPAVVAPVKSSILSTISCSDKCWSGGTGFCAIGVADRNTCLLHPPSDGATYLSWKDPSCCCFCKV